ncbi:DUF7173 family protein [Acidithiobacillus sp.]|uniref:DUF7173 family protein n=1 Tax=Acidithiobacillus sp. TaxID=1872118 RepID=UPI003D0014EE
MSGSLMQDWIEAKKAEGLATERRRHLEDRMIKEYQIDTSAEGTRSIADGDYLIKVVPRIDRKVDVDMVTEIAAEHGLSGILSQLFRWKAEINKSVWNHTDAELIKPLYDAITSRPGRPSFTITQKEL